MATVLDDSKQAANRLAQYVNHRAPNGPPAMETPRQLGNSAPPQTALQTTGYKPNFTMGASDPLNVQSRVVPDPNGVTDARPKYNPANGSPEAKAWQAQRAPQAPMAAPATAPAATGVTPPSQQGAAYRAGSAVGRLGATTGRALGAIAAPAALASTGTEVANTPTDAYEKRFGLGANNIDGVGGLVRDVGVRALGAASDLGDAMTLGLAGKYLYADKQDNALPAAASFAAPSPVGAAAQATVPADTPPNGGETDSAITSNVGTAPASAVAALGSSPSTGAVLPDGVFKHGRGQYSDQAGGMGFAPGFTGQPSVQNLAAADRLASSMGSPTGAANAVAAPSRYSAPTVAHSGNDWQARQNLKNMETAASSITNTRRWGGPGAENGPDVQAYRDAHRADLAARGKQVDAELTTQGFNVGLDREQMGQEGANTRAGMHERGAAARAMGQLNLGQQRLGLDAQRAAGENAVRSTQVRAADRLSGIQDQYLGAKTDEERTRIASQIRAMNGQGSEEAWAHSPGGQVVDPKTNMLVTQPGVIYNRRTGQAMSQQPQLPPPDQHAEAIAIRDDPKLSREEKADRLSKMGYQR